MAWSEPFHRQVALLLRVFPQVAEEECFALKGGTAINLLVRNMPRLSVDIDLTYLPIKPREASLADIDSAMRRIEGPHSLAGGPKQRPNQNRGHALIASTHQSACR